VNETTVSKERNETEQSGGELELASRWSSDTAKRTLLYGCLVPFQRVFLVVERSEEYRSWHDRRGTLHDPITLVAAVPDSAMAF
jgi:hypothetical protein